MSPFTCSKCGKDWPENYCPECARTINPSSSHEPDGAIIRGTFSTCAPKFHINPVRYLWHKSETRPLLQAWFILLLTTAACIYLRWWIVGAVFFLLALPLGWLLWWIYRRTDEIFYNALLTAGMVVSQRPTEFICVADMGTGCGKNACAIKRIAIRRLPVHSSEIGTEFPCVSGFHEGSSREFWADFNPQPLSFGTGNSKLIDDRKEKIGEDAFKRLRQIYREGNFPKQADKMTWVDDVSLQQIPPPALPKPPVLIRR